MAIVVVNGGFVAGHASFAADRHTCTFDGIAADACDGAGLVAPRVRGEGRCVGGTDAVACERSGGARSGEGVVYRPETEHFLLNLERG